MAKTAPVAPTIYKPLGRPPIKGKRDADEPRNSYRVSRANNPIKCGRRQRKGYNARGCKANVNGKTPSQRRNKV